MTDEAAQAHWERAGSSEGRSPNFTAHMTRNPVFAGRLPETFSAGAYRYFNPDLQDGIREAWQAAIHYVQHGYAERRKFCLDVPAFGSYRTLDEMLRQNGILSDGFVAYFDVQDYLTFNSTVCLRGIWECVRHFVELGRAALCPLSVDAKFDQAFYARHRPDAPADPAEAYLHWINVGEPAGIPPNARVLMKSIGLRDLTAHAGGFDATTYLAFNADVARLCQTPWDALRHLLAHGLVERREGRPEPHAAFDLYLAAADRLAIAERFSEARRLYQLALAGNPASGTALRHYGDCLLRLGEHFAAAETYRRAMALGKANIWTYLNIAQCEEEMGFPDASAAMLRMLRDQAPGDLEIARKAEKAATRSFEAKLQAVARMTSVGLLEQGRAHMTDAARTLAAALATEPRQLVPGRQTVRAVAIVADMGLPQCRFYRVEQKIEQLKVAGIAVTVFDYSCTLDGFPGALPFVDAVIFYRVPAFPAIVKAIDAARRARLPTFYEIDDLIFDGTVYPDSFESYGGQISRDIYAGLVTGTGLLETAMSLCDYAIASTPSLAAIMQRHVISGRAFVHRNALSGPHLAWLQRSETARPDASVVSIFYGTGTKAHNADFDTVIAPVLERLLSTHKGRLRVIIAGYLTLPPSLWPFADQVFLFEPVWDLDVYWNALAHSDINLAVLNPGVIADCKSEIKWLEAAMLGIPSVVSRTRTYAEIIDDGVDGLLAETQDEWFKALQSLILNPARRRKLGHAARQKVRVRYGLEAAADNLTSMFSEVVAEPRVGEVLAMPRVAVAKPKLRVLIVNVFFPPQAIGGATRVVAGNVRDLVAAHGDDLHVEVFTTTEGGETPYQLRSYDWNGIKVTSVTASDVGHVDWMGEDPRMAEVFGRYLDHFKPEIVHFHSIQRLTASVCQAARSRGIPYYVTVHDAWWISDSMFLLDDSLQRTMYDYGDPAQQLHKGSLASLHRMKTLAAHLAEAREILAVSESFAQVYRDCGFANVRVVENGVSALAVVPRRPAPDGRVRMALIGGAAPHKGFNLLRIALAAADFRNLSLLVLDHALPPGEENADLWGGTKVRFRGRVPQDEVSNLYAEIDVLLAPSLWPESYGLVTREALQAGCWVIASNRGAIGQDVTPGNGFVVDVDTQAELQAALGCVNADPPRYRGPIETVPTLRRSVAQADELAQIYLEGRRAALSLATNTASIALHRLSHPPTAARKRR